MDRSCGMIGKKTEGKTTMIDAKLLSWYDAHARNLPWRGISDPYRTWVSETMLQQTRVETVLGYYARFLERFPSLKDLAEAEEADVLKLWEGLGYYSRARNLHQGAKQVMAEFGGNLPSSAEQLRTIRGIGPYTAGAIASIAFGQAVPAVDGNVIRVVSRLKGLRENVAIPSVRREIENQAATLVSRTRPGDFNQALMDLGATICTPGTPSCEKCPLREECSAFADGDAEDLPVLPRKNPPRILHYDVYVALKDGRVLMRQRTEAMLRGLWVFPMTGEHAEPDAMEERAAEIGLHIHDVHPMGEARHVFTHQVWEMRLYLCHASGEAPRGYSFLSLTDMEAVTIPTAMRAAVKIARDQLK